MIIFEEKASRLIEMAKLNITKIPHKILDRTRRFVVDNWWFDRQETDDLYKVGFRLSLATNIKPFQGIDFDFGFLRPYKQIHHGKSTGARNNPNYEFKAIHIICSIPGALGQWYLDNFKDSDFENVVRYVDAINVNTLDVAEINKIIRDLKLKPAVGSNINILSILDQLLK